MKFFRSTSVLLASLLAGVSLGQVVPNNNDIQQQVRDAAIAIHEAQMANSLIFLLRGSGFVPTMRPIDMPENFVAFKLVTDAPSGSGGIMDMIMSPMMMMMGAFGAMGASTNDNNPQGMAVLGAMDLSWSNGTTVEYGERRYLVTYKASLDAADLGAMDKRDSFVDVPLKLTLVRVDSIKVVTPRPDMTKARFVDLMMTKLPKPAKPSKESIGTPNPPPKRQRVA
jgi:hypothetical protein